MRRTLLIPTALLVTAIALTGCSAASSTDYNQSGGVSGPVAVQPNSQEIASDSGGVATDQSSVDRQVITTGWVTITVDNPLDAASQAVAIAEKAGGRVDSRNEYAPANGDRGSASLTLRLPAKSLTEALDELKKLGVVQEVSINATDVTMTTQDIDARITALTATIDRLTALLATATDTDALIKIETAIGDRQAELESLQSQQRYYADQVALSTVTVNLISVADTPASEPNNFLTGLQTGWNAFVAFFAGLLVALGVLLPWLIFAGIVTFVVIFFVKRNAKKKLEAPTTPPTE